MSTGSIASLPLGVAVDVSLARLFVTNEGEANVAVFALPRTDSIPATARR
jgi:hypothetical protein